MIRGLLPGTLAAAGALWTAAAPAQGLELAPYKPALQGQVILNPEPDHSAPSPVRRVLVPLAEPVPDAGSAVGQGGDQAVGQAGAQAGLDCPIAEGWQVVVVRGTMAPDIVRGHMITVLPPGC